MPKTRSKPLSIVMLGTSLDTKGGISSVIQVYKRYGLFERFPFVYIATHCDGSAWKKLVQAVTALGRFIRLLLRGEVALVHAHTASRASFWRKSLFLWPAYWLKVPVIVHLHGAEFRTFYGKECNPFGKAFVRAVFRRATRVIALSEEWRRWIESTMQIGGVITLYNPIPLPPVDDLTTERRQSILFLGRLGQRKGVYDLLEAVAGLAPRFPDVVLQLGGDGETQRVQSIVRERRLDPHVKVLGWVGGAEKAELLRQAAIFVLPSYNEGLPMSVLEAMSYELPVVSTPVGGIAEAVQQGVTGFLVTPGDTQALAEAIGRLLADAELRRSFGKAGRHAAETKFAMDDILPRLERLYDELGVEATQATAQIAVK